jgi:hypothetical protein
MVFLLLSDVRISISVRVCGHHDRMDGKDPTVLVANWDTLTTVLEGYRCGSMEPQSQNTQPLMSGTCPLRSPYYSRLFYGCGACTIVQQ